MMKKTIILTLIAISANWGFAGNKKQPVDYVDNTIGNISHLLVPTFPTCHQPNSMLRMNPGRYEFVTDRMTGFPLNVPSHRQGDVLLLMPYCGDSVGLSSNLKYRYDQEESKPYRYSVLLDDYGIIVDFAPGKRAAIFTCDFEKEGNRYIQIKTQGEGEITGEANTFYGYDVCHNAKQYFYLEFDKYPISFKTSSEGKYTIYAKFDNKTDKIRIRYGVSFISVEQAKKNLRNELKDFDLNSLSEVAKREWNKVLGKIKIEGGSEDQKTIFYTALYRSHERMINISEDGRYFSGFDNKVHDDKGVPFWTDDWVWDTYHALHPLQTILNPIEQEQKLASYIRMYEQSGWMPTFPCFFGDAHCMNGNHAAVIFADALSKGLKFDVSKAYEGLNYTVMNETMIPWRKAPKTELDDFYHQKGWFPGLAPDKKETVPLVDNFEKRQSVAVTQAASYDDWSIAQLAKYLRNDSDYNFHIKRAFNYRNLFNAKTGFFHPKDESGNFIEPFNYVFPGGIGGRSHYAENNAWTYIWNVHHNIEDLIHLFGGKQQFVDKLDRLFTESIQLSKWKYYAVMPDATGNVGQYVMGNEPSFHIPYLYNYAGEPWKTQKRIRMLMESWFRNDLMGVPGDEDGGGISSFYVFSAMGFYPVTPGMPYYTIGSPLFDKIIIDLQNGKKFRIITKNNSKNNKYIRSAMLNGKIYNKTYFSHTDILEGGTLVLEMSDRPNMNWGVSNESIPPSEGVEIKLMK